MKKIISLTAVLLTGMSILASCGAKTPDETTEAATAEAFFTTTEAPASPSEETTETPEDYQAITEKSTARSTATAKPAVQSKTTTTKPTTKTTTASPMMGGGPPVHLPYRMEYGALPDAVQEYAREKNGHAAVQTYLNQMYAKYDARYTKGDTTVDNELYYFMKEFNIPEDVVAQKLQGVFTDAEFKIICANDQKALNRAFYNHWYCYFSELDGKIYPLHEICKMTTEELRKKQIPKEAILKLIDAHSDGVFDFSAGRDLLTKDELAAFRKQIAAM